MRYLGPTRALIRAERPPLRASSTGARARNYAGTQWLPLRLGAHTHYRVFVIVVAWRVLVVSLCMSVLLRLSVTVPRKLSCRGWSNGIRGPVNLVFCIACCESLM